MFVHRLVAGGGDGGGGIAGVAGADLCKGEGGGSGEQQRGRGQAGARGLVHGFSFDRCVTGPRAGRGNGQIQASEGRGGRSGWARSTAIGRSLVQGTRSCAVAGGAAARTGAGAMAAPMQQAAQALQRLSWS